MKKKILIVDDSEFVRNYHSHILTQADFDVLTAVDGNDGLEKLYMHPCDVILTDINMGHMDGYEFIRRIRAEVQYEDLPIIIISTEGGNADKMRGFEAGANLYIVKPSEPAVMIENIRLVLAGR
ncbi:MAG TPA: response regulator [Bryobacteraceae bacterium]|nr:response regulator [Bryobacteraceae bacterium]